MLTYFTLCASFSLRFMLPTGWALKDAVEEHLENRTWQEKGANVVVGAGDDAGAGSGHGEDGGQEPTGSKINFV